MLIGGTLCFSINPRVEEKEPAMARAELDCLDVEEGEISDGKDASEETRLDRIRESRDSGGSRVWGQRYGEGRWAPKYKPDLYNFAWAQAVQSKPADGVGVKDIKSDYEKWVSSFVVGRKGEEKGDDEEKIDAMEKGNTDGGVDEASKDLEKEEGEIEEGEIGMEDAPGNSTGISFMVKPSSEDVLQEDGSGGELDNTLGLIQSSLKEFSLKDPAKSFSDGCIALKDASEKLKAANFQLRCAKKLDTVKDLVVQQIYDGVHSVYTAYHSLKSNLGGQDREAISSLLDSLSNDTQSLFSRKQIKEFEAMIVSIVRDKKVEEIDLGIKLSPPNFVANESLLRSKQRDTSRKTIPGPLFIDPFQRVDGKPEGHGFQWDRDETNLPSPTPASDDKKLLVEPKEHAEPEGIPKDTRIGGPENDNEDIPVYPSLTDAFKAVSSYQQKFSVTSFWSGNQLPSPTPSAECEAEDGDNNEEVSSRVENRPAGIYVVRGTSPSPEPLVVGRTPPSLQPLGSILQKEQSLMSTTKSVPVTSALSRAQLKARDPRLRLTESDTAAIDLNQFPVSVANTSNRNDLHGSGIISRKHGVAGDALLEGQYVKRPRNDYTDGVPYGTIHEVPGRGGWLEESTIPPVTTDGETFTSKQAEILTDRMMRIQNKEILRSNAIYDSALPVSSSGTSTLWMPNPNELRPPNAHIPAPNAAAIPPSITMPDLLNGINPDILIQLIKKEQERLTAHQSQQVSSEKVLPRIPSPFVLPTATTTPTVGLLKPPDQRPAIVPIQAMPSVPPKEELGRARMKPRDPRHRFLQENALQKTENMPPKRPELNSFSVLSFQGKKDLPMNQDCSEYAEAAPSLSTPSHLPDISQKLTSALKSVSDIMSASQLTNMASGGMPTELVPPKPIALVGSGTSPEHGNNISVINKSNGDDLQSQDPWGDVDHLLDGLDEQQRVSIQKERARRIEEQNNMFAKGKLCLVLDLDHTLLNSAKFVEVDQVHEEILRKKEEIDRDKAQRHLFRFTHMGMWTKLRPGIWNFLERASELYELHLYTMGNKVYATEMAKVLDPTGALFAGRVISKGDDGDPFDGDERLPKSKDLDGVLGMESAVLIIDDSVKVWPHHRHNLILVERYTYFPCSRRQFGLFGPSLLEIDHDERPEDGTLASSLAVIERIHQSFFSNSSLSNVDVRDILVSEQRRILLGCRIIFSRVFPVGEANPHLHPLWKLAEQFGATCTNLLDEHVTHVVANSLGTDKVNWAISVGRFIVNPGWLEASALLYRRANESDFAIKP